MSEAITKEIKGLSEAFGKVAPTIESMGAEIRDLKSAVAEWQKTAAKTPDGVMPNDRVSDGFKAFRNDLLAHKSIENKDFTVASIENPPSGGYTVTPDYVNRIFEKHYNESPIMQYAEVIDVSSNIGELYYETDDGEGNWVGELEPRTGTAGSIGRASIPVYEYTFPINVSMQLIEDSNIANLETYLVNRAVRKMNRAMGDAFTTGDGHKKPEGVFASPILETVPSGNASEITTKGLIDAMGAIPNDLDSNCKWFMDKRTFLAIAAKYGEDNSWINMPLGDRIRPNIFGYDVVYVNAPTIAAGSIPIVFGDMFEAYKVVRRLAINTRVDYETGWEQGIVKIKNRMRVGGQLLMPEALVGIKVGAS